MQQSSNAAMQAKPATQAKQRCGVDIAACIDVDADKLPRFQKSAALRCFVTNRSENLNAWKQGGQRKRSGSDSL